MSKNIVWRLLRRNISAGQLAGYALANLAGLAIVLTAIQFYRDITTVWDDEDSFISNDYLIYPRKSPDSAHSSLRAMPTPRHASLRQK